MNRYALLGFARGGSSSESDLMQLTAHLIARSRVAGSRTASVSREKADRLIGAHAPLGLLGVARELSRAELIFVNLAQARSLGDSGGSVKWGRVFDEVEGDGDELRITVSDRLMEFSDVQLAELHTRYEKSPLDNPYAKKLYNLISTAGLLAAGHLSTSPEALIEMLNIEHLTSFARFNTLNSRLICPCINQINDRTSLNIRHSKITYGRKVVSLDLRWSWETITLPSGHELVMR